jgi:hypothetical protein
MRYFWLIGALVFSLSFADDGLGDLVRKTEGKKRRQQARAVPRIGQHLQPVAQQRR